jgi:hypothetical protein
MREEGLNVSCSPSPHPPAGREAANVSALIHERQVDLAPAAEPGNRCSPRGSGRVPPPSEGLR